MYCQECGEEIPDYANSCPNCGNRHGQQQAQAQQTGQAQTQQTGQAQAQQTGQAQAQQTGQAQAQQTGGYGQGASLQDYLSSISIIGGIVYGAIAFITSFIVTAILVFTELEGETNNLDLYVGDQILALFGWFFYNAHTVSITNSATSETANILETAYQTAGSAATVPKLAYYVLPVVVLFLLGYVLADRASPSDASPIESAVAGASIALGYGVIAFLAGNSVFTITIAGESVGPQSGSVIMMMVLLYPVVIGGAAGYLSRA